MKTHLSRWVGCVCLVLLFCSGCSHYSEQFTYLDSQTGMTNHVVRVRHATFLMWGEANKLETETQTAEFIRTVNAEGIILKPDSEAIKSLTEGVVEGVIEGMKVGSGIP